MLSSFTLQTPIRVLRRATDIATEAFRRETLLGAWSSGSTLSTGLMSMAHCASKHVAAKKRQLIAAVLGAAPHCAYIRAMHSVCRFTTWLFFAALGMALFPATARADDAPAFKLTTGI